MDITGKLIFLGSFGNPGKALAFSVKDGVINPTPEVLSLEKLPAANYGGAINYYSETEAIACMPGQRPVLYSISNGTYSKVAEGNSKIFGGYDQSFRFFVFNEQKYMAFVREDGGLKDGCLRIMPLNGETLADDFDALEQALIDGDTIHALYFGLGNPDEYPFAGYKQANANADCVVRVIGGETYICAVSSCGAGVSLFKVEK